MLQAPSTDFVNAMARCLDELSSASNVTDDTNMTDQRMAAVSGACNETVLTQIDSYTTPLIQSHFMTAMIYLCILGVSTIVGTFGNIIILLVNATSKTMNKIGRSFTINLALADLCVAAIADPMCILGVIKGEKWFQGRWILCEMVASMCLTACFCAFLSLTMMTFNRFVYVCFYSLYHTIFKKPICFCLCVACWLCAFFFEYPNLIGWGDHYFDDKSHQCIWDRTASLSYTLFVSIGLIGGPLFIMAVFFVLIFRTIWKTKMDLFCDGDHLRKRHLWIESLRASKTLAIMFVAFLICWTPYAVITAVDVNNDYPTNVHMFVTLLAHTHSSLNFTIYMCSNKTFRLSVLQLFRKGGTSMKYNRTSDNGAKKNHSSMDSNTQESQIKYFHTNNKMAYVDVDAFNKEKVMAKRDMYIRQMGDKKY